MNVTAQSLVPWCRTLLGVDPPPHDSLEDYLSAIPRLDTLADLPGGTRVLVRGDVDAKPGARVGEGDVRLRSMVETLEWGRQRGWVQVIFGHIGRKPEGSLDKVAARLGELLGDSVELVRDWLDPESLEVTSAAADRVTAASPGTVLVLENTRRYEIERVLWNAGADDLPRLSESLSRFSSELAAKVGDVYVNEALSAGSLDTSTTVVPAAMRRVALGRYVAREFDGPLRRCLRTQLVVFSGLKIDKLDDLEAMIARGTIRLVIAAGSLAMALKKAQAQLDGGDFALGVAEEPEHRDKPYFIPPERIAQARGMIEQGRASGVEFVLPVDFVLADGSTSAAIGPGQQQLDVGPQTSALLEQIVGRFIEEVRRHPPSGGQAAVAFYNGVFGKFEDPQFEEGTRRFIPQLKRMKDAGIEVYVGGGEGGTALEKYGQDDWVTHTFTAGGTVLNALGGKPVPYLLALEMAARGG